MLDCVESFLMLYITLCGLVTRGLVVFIGRLETNFNDILIEIPLNGMHLKMSE